MPCLPPQFLGRHTREVQAVPEYQSTVGNHLNVFVLLKAACMILTSNAEQGQRSARGLGGGTKSTIERHHTDLKVRETVRKMLIGV